MTAAVLGAGSASAAEWSVNPDDGYVYIALDHNETAFLSNTGIPDWIDQTSTPQHQFADPAWYSTSPLFQDSYGNWYSGYSFAQLWREAATHPDGSVDLWLTDPGQYNGTVVQMRQY
ncbi:hypothetical protein [Nocardia heshunensis]